MNEIIKKDIGLVLCGGGTKGAYEIGVWKALQEAGLFSRVTGLSGSSIGAFNSALMADNDLEKAQQIWLEAGLFDFANLNKELIIQKVARGLKKSVAENIFDNLDIEKATKKAAIKLWDKSAVKSKDSADFLEEKAKQLINPLRWKELKRKKTEISPEQMKYNRNTFRNFNVWFMKNLVGSGYATPDKLKSILEKNTVLEPMRIGSLDIYSTVCEWDTENDAGGKARYISWKGLSRQQIIELIITSASLPVLYPEISKDGKTYVDGGYADNEPVKPLYDAGYKKILIIYLDKYKGKELKKRIKEQNESFPECHIQRLIPGDDFDDSFTKSCIISQKMTQKRMQAGYTACHRLLKETNNNIF